MKVVLNENDYQPIIIVENFLDASVFEQLNETCSKLPMFIDDRNRNRITTRGPLPAIDHILYSNIQTNRRPLLPTEYRKYFEGSDGFDWHVDTLLDTKKYYECVLTMDDTSDCKFEYKLNKRVVSIKPKPNTLVMVRPKILPHRVTPLNHGYRTILKFIVCL